MNKILNSIFIFILFNTVTYCQDDIDTNNFKDDTDETEFTDPERQHITDIIKEVNKRFMDVNNVIASGEIKVKTSKLDESADIEIKSQKKDDIWFHIDGPLGVDVAEAHFNKKKFIFYNALKDEVVTGSSTILNIGALTKIRCTFNDLMNAFTGTVRIPISKKDSLWMDTEGSNNIISVKKGTITIRYWVSTIDYSVSKYIYYNKRGKNLIQFDFSNFSNYGSQIYARRIEVRRPSKGEYFRLSLEEYTPDIRPLSFSVYYPSDVKRKTWR